MNMRKYENYMNHITTTESLDKKVLSSMEAAKEQPDKLIRIKKRPSALAVAAAFVLMIVLPITAYAAVKNSWFSVFSGADNEVDTSIMEENSRWEEGVVVGDENIEVKILESAFCREQNMGYFTCAIKILDEDTIFEVSNSNEVLMSSYNGYKYYEFGVLTNDGYVPEDEAAYIKYKSKLAKDKKIYDFFCDPTTFIRGELANYSVGEVYYGDIDPIWSGETTEDGAYVVGIHYFCDPELEEPHIYLAKTSDYEKAREEWFDRLQELRQRANNWYPEYSSRREAFEAVWEVGETSMDVSRFISIPFSKTSTMPCRTYVSSEYPDTKILVSPIGICGTYMEQLDSYRVFQPKNNYSTDRSWRADFNYNVNTYLESGTTEISAYDSSQGFGHLRQVKRKGEKDFSYIYRQMFKEKVDIDSIDGVKIYYNPEPASNYVPREPEKYETYDEFFLMQ